MDRRRVFTLLRWIFLAVLIGAGIWYGTAHPQLLQALSQISIWWLLPLAVLILIGKALQGLQLRLLTSIYRIRLSFAEWFGLTVCKSMYGYLLPGRPGAGVQAVYLKKRHEFSFAHFSSLFAATALIDAGSAASVGLLACVALHSLVRQVHPFFSAVFGAVLGACAFGCVILLFARGVTRYVPTQSGRDFAERAVEGLGLLRKNPGILLEVIGLGVARLVFDSGALFVACVAFDLRATFLEAVLMFVLSTFGMLLPLTPGSIGVNEGIIVAAGGLLGIRAGELLLAALVRRAIGLSLFFLLGWAFTHFLLGRFVEPENASDQTGKDKKMCAGDG